MRCVAIDQSTWGSAMLVAGCCIGAGMVGLPLVTLSSGFFFSLFPLIFSWGYMYFSGLMILEVYIGEGTNQNLMGLLENILGRRAKILGGCLFLFLFYCLLTAYLNGSSLITRNGLTYLLGIDISQVIGLGINTVLLLFTLLWGTKKIDQINRGLFFLMVFFYFCLVFIGIPQVRLDHILFVKKQPEILFTIPIFLASFGFQNLIPTLSGYLNNEISRTRSALFRGTGCAFFIYLVWIFVILGMISYKGSVIQQSETAFIAQLFEKCTSWIILFITGFVFFAIATSLLTVAFSVTNFIGNVSEITKNQSLYSILAVAPPCLFSLLDPNLFLFALHIAGGIVAVCLFGILPWMMVWKARYVLYKNHQRVFPYGKGGLLGYLGVSIGVLIIEIIHIAMRG